MVDGVDAAFGATVKALVAVSAESTRKLVNFMLEDVDVWEGGRRYV